MRTVRKVADAALATHRRYGADAGGFMGAALTYNAFLSLFPLLLLGASVLGFVLANDPSLRRQATETLATALPGIGSIMGDNIDALVRARSATGVIGLIGLLWTGTGVADAASTALARLEHLEQRLSTIRTKLRSIITVLALGVIALAGVGVSVLVAAVDVAGPAAIAVRSAGIVVSFAIDTALFLAAYRLLGPNGRSITDRLPGALLASAGWTILKYAGGWYAARTATGSSAVYGTFASTVAVLVVLSLTARLFLYGAALNALLAERRGGETTMAERQQKIGGNGQRSTPTLVRSIATDTATLVRKEVELARHEVVEALVARLMAGAAMVVAGMLALLGIAFLGSAAAHALEGTMSPWAARLVVAGGFIVLASLAAAIGVMRAKRPSLKPEKTVETVKEDIEWAKTQLKR